LSNSSSLKEKKIDCPTSCHNSDYKATVDTSVIDISAINRYLKVVGKEDLENAE